MHICKNVCIFLYMYVGVHACMCVRQANDFIDVKTETKYLICCEEIPTFYRQARFLLRQQILPRQLPHLPRIRSYVRHCRLTQSVLPLERKKLYTTLGIWGAKSFLFRNLGGLAP